MLNDLSTLLILYANIADFAIRSVTPACPINRIRDCLAQFMTTDQSKRIDRGTTRTVITRGEWCNSIKDCATNKPMIAALCLAGAINTVHRSNTWWEVDEVQSVTVGLRYSSLSDPLLECLLDFRIVDLSAAANFMTRF